MSDDDSLYDEDDYIYFDDFPYNEAEDLAANVTHSPVYINYDPAIETASVPSDWEYYSDRYWDDELPVKREHRGGVKDDAHNIRGGAKRKRRKLHHKKEIPDLSLNESTIPAPTVIWKPKNEISNPTEGPVVSEGEGEKVSLLKDWRERFNIHQGFISRPKPKPTNWRGKRQVTAMVPDSSSPETYHSNTPPPTAFDDPQSLPLSDSVYPSTTKEIFSVVDGISLDALHQRSISESSDSSTLINESTLTCRKRKDKSPPSNDVVNLQAPKKTPGPTKKQKPIDLVMKHSQNEEPSHANERNRLVRASGKRTQGDADEQSAMPPLKRRHAVENKGAEAPAAEAKEASNHPTTRRARR